MGHAAHAMTPWQGSGASQAIEDALVLSTLLAQIRDVSELDNAFQAYDTVRRPRGQAIIASSKITGQILCGRSKAGLDPAKLRGALAPRWKFIHGLDMEDHKAEALAAFAALKK